MSMLFNVLAGQASVSKLAFDPTQTWDDGSGATVTVTDTVMTVDGESGLALTTNGSFGDLNERLGVYFKINDVSDPTTNGTELVCYSGLCSGDGDFSGGTTLPSFLCMPAILIVKDGSGVVTKTLDVIGDLNTGDASPFWISLTITPSTEFCIAYEADQGPYGTCYLYSSESPSTVLASHAFTSAHAEPAQFFGYIYNTTSVINGTTIIRNPTVEHAGVRNVGA